MDAGKFEIVSRYDDTIIQFPPLVEPQLTLIPLAEQTVFFPFNHSSNYIWLPDGSRHEEPRADRGTR
jgi:hypothetical protein